MSDLDLLVEMFAKVGKPMVEKKASKPAPVDYQPIVMDINWLNDYDEATAPEARKRLRKAAQTVAGQDITNLESVIKALNGLLEEGLTQKERQNHVETVAKIEIIRTLHNLLGSEIKGGGEGGINGVGAAIAGAIDDAIGQVGAVTELPVTPQRMREILNRADQEQ